MSPAFCRAPRCGRPARSRCRRSGGRAVDGRTRSPRSVGAGCAAPPTRARRDAKHRPVSVKDLALGLPQRAWRTIGWREGTAERLSSRFARLRVRAAHRGKRQGEEWLLIEWPQGADEPTKYWLSTLARDITFE